jgi:hypothetical protein
VVPRESLELREAPRAILKEWLASEDQRLRQAKTTKVGDLVQDALLDGHKSSHAIHVMANKGKDAAKQLEDVLSQRDSEDLELLRIGSYLISRPETSNWSRTKQLPSGHVLTLGQTALAKAQITSKLKFHFGEVRAWPPGTHDEWTALDVPSGLTHDSEATEAACGASNAVVNVKARKEDRQWHDWENEGDLWDDPVFASDNSVIVDHCNPDLNNAITTFIVRDKSFFQGFDHQWCVRDGQGITLAELLLQFKATHTYEQLYLSWLSCKLLIRRRLGWATPVLFPSHVACCTASLTWSGLHFSQFLDIHVSVAPMWR